MPPGAGPWVASVRPEVWVAFNSGAATGDRSHSRCWLAIPAGGLSMKKIATGVHACTVRTVLQLAGTGRFAAADLLPGACLPIRPQGRQLRGCMNSSGSARTGRSMDSDVRCARKCDCARKVVPASGTQRLPLEPWGSLAQAAHVHAARTGPLVLPAMFNGEPHLLSACAGARQGMRISP
jgi:hypothetical protein